MAMGPLKRKKTLVWRVRVFRWGWSMAMGPLKGKKTLIGRVRVVRMVEGNGAFEKEEDSGWAGQGV